MFDPTTDKIDNATVVEELAPILQIGGFYKRQFIEETRVPSFKTDYMEITYSRKLLNKGYRKAKSPSEIISDFLYLSGADTSANGYLLAEHKITHIINISPCVNFFELRVPKSVLREYPDWGNPKYLRLYVPDDPSKDIGRFFEISNLFINNAKKKGGRVLVHCMAGVSRSASLILAYLMNQYGYSYLDAFKYVRDKRSIIRPNWGFLLQLTKYEIGLMRVPVGPSGTKRKYDEMESGEI